MIRSSSATATTSATSSGVDVDTQRRRCCSTTRSSSPAATTSTGRASSARTSRPPATPGSTWRSSAATRSSGRPAGSRASTARTRPNRTLVSYKETHFNAPIDPQDPPTWTGTWRDPRFSPPADGGKPAERADRPVVHRQLGHRPTSRCPRSTASCGSGATPRWPTSTAGQTLTLGPGIGTLGYEWDVDADNGFRPAGLIRPVLDDRQRRRGRSPTTAAPRSTAAPRPTT